MSNCPRYSASFCLHSAILNGERLCGVDRYPSALDAMYGKLRVVTVRRVEWKSGLGIFCGFFIHRVPADSTAFLHTHRDFAVD